MEAGLGSLLEMRTSSRESIEASLTLTTARERRSIRAIALHLSNEGPSERVERRFHVDHFRGRIGDCFYELLRSSPP